MKKSLTLASFALLAAASLAALPSAATRSRADDGGLWHAEDNPAQMARGAGGIALGLAYDSEGSVKVAGLLPLIGYYSFRFDEDTLEMLVGNGFSFGKALALGYDYAHSTANGSSSSYDIGLLYRPAGFLSLGLTGSIGTAGDYAAGLGLALRPLAVAGDDRPSSRALSISADMGWSESQGLYMENLGLRLGLGGIADIRAWYQPEGFSLEPQGFGLELRLALGPTGLTATTTAPTEPLSSWVLAEDISFQPSMLKAGKATLPSSGIGRRILVIKDLDAITPLPVGQANALAFLSTKRSMTFPALLTVLEEARRDRGVQAVAFEKLPALGGGGAAYYQEFVDELGLFRKAGKKVYFYGETFNQEYAFFAAQADGISLNPLGALGLAGFSYHSAYYKQLFDKLGIRFVNLAPWDTKSAFNSFSMDSMPPGEEAMMRRFYGDVQEQISLDLGVGRAGKLVGTADEAIAGGPYLSASEALEAGLVDSLAYEGEFEEGLRKAHPGATLVSGLGRPGGEGWGGPAFSRKAAVVYLSGSIGLGKGNAGQDIGSSAALEIERLRKDRAVAGIVLRVDSPGGVVLTSDLIAREVRLAVEAGKPVVVSMAHVAASGGYYISAPASWIVAEPMTVTGSIGVTGLVPIFSGALAKLGVNYEGFDLSPGASLIDPAKELDEAELAKLDAMIHKVYDRFINVVAAGRKMDGEAVRRMAEGNIYTGREALKLGLVDQLGGLAEAKAWLEAELGAKLSYVDIEPGESSPFGALSALSAGIEGLLSSDDEKSLESLFGPLAARLRGLLEMGSGPLYYFDAEGLGL